MGKPGREDDCEQVRALLDTFLAGMLPPADEQRVRAHLEACQDCQGELWALRLGRRVRGLLVPEVAYEGELARRRAELLESIGGSGQRPARIRQLLRWRWAIAAAAGALVAAGIIVGLRVPVPRPPVQPGRSPAQVPRSESGQLTQKTDVRFSWDGIQIVWVFDPHFEP